MLDSSGGLWVRACDRVQGIEGGVVRGPVRLDGREKTSVIGGWGMEGAGL